MGETWLNIEVRVRGEWPAEDTFITGKHGLNVADTELKKGC